jgi:2-methylisocitrate lyase-like PEP mutase family enzyme
MSKFVTFAALHVAGQPLMLFNAWDAGSAEAVAKSGAKAIASGSASVAMANGFGDGQEVPLDDALVNAARIAKAVDLPVTIDFEGGYADDLGELAANGRRLAETGASAAISKTRKSAPTGFTTSPRRPAGFRPYARVSAATSSSMPAPTFS